MSSIVCFWRVLCRNKPDISSLMDYLTSDSLFQIPCFLRNLQILQGSSFKLCSFNLIQALTLISFRLSDLGKMICATVYPSTRTVYCSAQKGNNKCRRKSSNRPLRFWCLQHQLRMGLFALTTWYFTQWDIFLFSWLENVDFSQYLYF